MKAAIKIGLLTLAGISCLMQSAVSQNETKVETMMQHKLLSSQSLLKGLALEDFELIETEAQRLHLLSQDVGWNIVQTKEYARLSTDFRRAAEHIREAGKKHNLDAAGLGYFKLTMTCIDCHRHVRGIKGK